MASIYSECTYRVCVCVCVCHVASGDKIKRNVRRLACDWCLSLRCILLNSNYCCIVKVGLFKIVLPAGQ